MAKFAINASGAMLLPSLVQVAESISGSVVPLAMFLKLHIYSVNHVRIMILWGDTAIKSCQGWHRLGWTLLVIYIWSRTSITLTCFECLWIAFNDKFCSLVDAEYYCSECGWQLCSEVIWIHITITISKTITITISKTITISITINNGNLPLLPLILIS